MSFMECSSSMAILGVVEQLRCAKLDWESAWLMLLQLVFEHAKLAAIIEKRLDVCFSKASLTFRYGHSPGLIPERNADISSRCPNLASRLHEDAV